MTGPILSYLIGARQSENFPIKWTQNFQGCGFYEHAYLVIRYIYVQKPWKAYYLAHFPTSIYFHFILFQLQVLLLLQEYPIPYNELQVSDSNESHDAASVYLFFFLQDFSISHTLNCWKFNYFLDWVAWSYCIASSLTECLCLLQ